MTRPIDSSNRPGKLLVAAMIGIILALSPVAQARADCADPTTGAGTATYYEYTPGSGACTYTSSDEGDNVVAMNPTDYDGSAMCGSYIRVTGPLGSVDVKVVDLFPFGEVGDIDLNRPAFEQIAGVGVGTAEVTWETVADPGSEPISMYIDASSNPWWTAVQARNHRYGIASVEYLGPSGYWEVSRSSYNFFVVETGLGGISTIDDPFTLRLTDIHGQAVVIEDIPHVPGGEHVSNEQFPVCSNLSAVPPHSGYALHHAVPNPFNPRTTIAFEIPSPNTVRLGVYDVAGRLIRRLVGGEVLGTGRHEVVWQGRDDAGGPVPSGLYFYRLDAGAFSETRRMVLLK